MVEPSSGGSGLRNTSASALIRASTASISSGVALLPPYQAGDGLNVGDRRDHALLDRGRDLDDGADDGFSGRKAGFTSAAVTMRYAPDKRICWTTISADRAAASALVMSTDG